MGANTDSMFLYTTAFDRAANGARWKHPVPGTVSTKTIVGSCVNLHVRTRALMIALRGPHWNICQSDWSPSPVQPVSRRKCPKDANARVGWRSSKWDGAVASRSSSSRPRTEWWRIDLTVRCAID